MNIYKKIIVGGSIASILALTPVVFAETIATPVKKPVVLPATASAKAQAAVKKADAKKEAAKKNKVTATKQDIVKKMEANKGTKQVEAEAKMKAELEALKAKAPKQ